MNLKWLNFLTKKQGRNFLNDNVKKIFDSLDQVPTQNATAEILDIVSERNFIDFINDHKLNRIFKDYEIDELLGHGIKGLAFTLKEPHENYVLKMEMHYHTGDTRPGVDYPQQVMRKQEAGQYDPTQVNVLESEAFENTQIDTKSHSENIDFYLSIMSKVQQSTYAGKKTGGMTTKDAMKDFAFSKAGVFIDLLISLRNGAIMNDLEGWIYDTLLYSKFGAALPRDNRNVLKRAAKILANKVQNESPESVVVFLYSIFQNQFQYLSKQQFLDLCKEYFDRAIDAKFAGKQFADFHGGNIGYGVTGKPASFDV
jgi:hypothetical protein